MTLSSATARGRRPIRALVCSCLALSLAACGTRRLAVVEPVPDPSSAAAAMEASTRLEAPLQVIFAWEAIDQGVRGRGRGVARAEPPARARLDLFLANGETALRAALVDGEVRLPPGAPGDLLPPPDLMWGALGVFRPGGDAVLLGGDRLEGGPIRLRYRYPNGGELHYQVRDGVLERVDVMRGGRVVEEVILTFRDAGRFPSEALYRHRTDFRELHLMRESAETVAPFPAEIWSPR